GRSTSSAPSVLPLESVRADPDADPCGCGGRAAGAEAVDLPGRLRVVALADQRVAGVRAGVRVVLARRRVGVLSEEDLHQGLGRQPRWAPRSAGDRRAPGALHGPWAPARRSPGGEGTPERSARAPRPEGRSPARRRPAAKAAAPRGAAAPGAQVRRTGTLYAPDPDPQPLPRPPLRGRLPGVG